MAMTILDIVKSAIRVSTTTFDEPEIAPIIEACKIDLKLAGVNNIDDTDALIQRAIILYAKSQFGYDENAERYAKAYDALKISLALSSDYNTVADNVE